jgi:hypothetical protein
MKSTLSTLVALALLAACAQASDEAELALDDTAAHVEHAAAVDSELPMTETAASGETAKPTIQVWKTVGCTCCDGWVEHLKAAGYPVEVEEAADINAIKRARGIPVRTWSCHTAEVDGYLVEGHVPAATIDRVLAERPTVAGVAVPGMPMGSPGMEMPGMEADPYQVMSFTAQGAVEVYEQH